MGVGARALSANLTHSRESHESRGAAAENSPRREPWAQLSTLRNPQPRKGRQDFCPDRRWPPVGHHPPPLRGWGYPKPAPRTLGPRRGLVPIGPGLSRWNPIEHSLP